jgi:hypothetical protein
VNIVNGLKTIAVNTTKLTAFTVSSEVTPTNQVCKDAANTTVAVNGAVFSADMAAGAAITCTLDVVVTPAHAAAGAIPAFTVTAALTSTPADISLSMEPIPVAAVPVQTGSTFAVADAVPRDGTYLSGE